MKLPRDTDEQKKERTRVLQAALMGAADVPLRVAEAAVEVGGSSAGRRDRQRQRGLRRRRGGRAGRGGRAERGAEREDQPGLDHGRAVQAGRLVPHRGGALRGRAPARRRAGHHLQQDLRATRRRAKRETRMAPRSSMARPSPRRSARSLQKELEELRAAGRRPRHRHPPGGRRLRRPHVPRRRGEVLRGDGARATATRPTRPTSAKRGWWRSCAS